MSMLCSLFGCNNTVDEIYGKAGEYVLYRCERCRKKIIFCAIESKKLNDDEEGRKILDLMMRDKEFSRQCRIHSEFVKAEFENPFNYKRQEKMKDQIRERYGLQPGFRQPDPIILFQKGLWQSAEPGNKKKGESKPKKASSKPKQKPESGERPIRVKGDLTGDNYDNVVNVTISFSKGDEDKRKDENKIGDKHSKFIQYSKCQEIVSDELSVEAQISRLERRMEKHVSKEEYEKAAKLRDQIIKLKKGK